MDIKREIEIAIELLEIIIKGLQLIHDHLGVAASQEEDSKD
jgi:hypothetical protein